MTCGHGSHLQTGGCEMHQTRRHHYAFHRSDREPRRPGRRYPTHSNRCGGSLHARWGCRRLLSSHRQCQFPLHCLSKCGDRVVSAAALPARRLLGRGCGCEMTRCGRSRCAVGCAAHLTCDPHGWTRCAAALAHGHAASPMFPSPRLSSRLQAVAVWRSGGHWSRQSRSPSCLSPGAARPATERAPQPVVGAPGQGVIVEGGRGGCVHAAVGATPVAQLRRLGRRWLTMRQRKTSGWRCWRILTQTHGGVLRRLAGLV